MRAITTKFGAEHVYRSEDGDWRTVVRDGRCIFQDPQSGACGIHSEDFYPAQCRAYPWHTVVASASDPDVFVNSGVAYAHAYDCPAMVLATLDVYFQELAANPAGSHRRIALDELTSKILPPGHEW
jgi:Fe-S-cluster containining protein